jgi:tRNA(Arg) A34 adenosine deaminase TadA
MTTAGPILSKLNHERFMRAAMEQGEHNAAWPFGAVIVNADTSEILARGFNDARKNATLHGEIVAFNNYVETFGHDRLASRVLYTTAEPCPMCMSAMIWAGMGGVVFGTSVQGLMQFGIRQIMLNAKDICARASFYEGEVLGGVLSNETDALFRDRPIAV